MTMTDDKSNVKTVGQKTSWEITKEELHHYATLIFKGKTNKARGYWQELGRKYGFDPEKVYLDKESRSFKLGRKDLSDDEKIAVSRACVEIARSCADTDTKVRQLVELLKANGNEVTAMKYADGLARIGGTMAAVQYLFHGVEKDLGTRNMWQTAVLEKAQDGKGAKLKLEVKGAAEASEALLLASEKIRNITAEMDHNDD